MLGTFIDCCHWTFPQQTLLYNTCVYRICGFCPCFRIRRPCPIWNIPVIPIFSGGGARNKSFANLFGKCCITYFSKFVKKSCLFKIITLSTIFFSILPYRSSEIKDKSVTSIWRTSAACWSVSCLRQISERWPAAVSPRCVYSGLLLLLCGVALIVARL